VLALGFLLSFWLPILHHGAREAVRWWGAEALFATGAAACLARAAAVARGRSTWLLLGAGIAAYGLGSLIGVISDRPVDDPPVASYVGWLLFYAAAYPALVLLLRRRLQSFSFSFWLDGLVGALALAASCAAFVPPHLGDVSTLKAIAGMAFPILDLVLLSLVLWACALTGWRGGQWAWLGLALAVLTVGDIVLDLQVLHHDYDPLTPTSACFGVTMLAIGVAAWRPEAPPRPLRTDTLAILAMPGLCVVAVLCVLLVGGTDDAVTQALGLAAVAVAFLRGVLSFGDLRALHKNRRFRRGFDEAAIGMALVSTDLRVNAATCRLLGRSAEELLGRSVLEVTHPDDRAPSVALRDAVVAGRPGAALEKRMVRPDGTIVTVEITTVLVDGDDEHDSDLFFTQLVDRTQHRRAEVHAATLARISYAALELLDAPTMTAVVTEAVREAMPARACRLELEPAAAAAILDGDLLCARVQRRNGAPAALVAARDADAGAYGDDAARFLSSAANLLGAALDRVAVEDELRAQALEDPLTGLANRSYLAAHVEQAIASVGRGEHLGLLLLDLDRFKVVNDTLGHGAGDELLCAVAERLRATVRAGDLVARLGGDEFVVACTSHDDGGARIVALAQRLLDALVEPYVVDGRELHLSASAGLVFVDHGETTAEALLRDADVAMYRAKEHGGARFEVFDARLRARVVQRMATESALRRALDRDELLLHFQPIMDLRRNALVGFEALVRWGHPERGLVPPGDFIDVAEETGLIVPTGRWVLHQAVHALAALEAAAGRPLRMGVNLSARQLSATLVQEVRDALTDAGVAPTALTLEVTETLLVEGPGALEILGELRALGVAIAIDDFGTGWSSLGALQSYPADVLKLDRSLVAPAAGSVPSAALARAVIEMGHALGLDVVAEGIEDAAQLDAMQLLGCPHGQGFVFARPMTLEQAVTLVAAASTPVPVPSTAPAARAPAG
jgi:diguanylate cyclase (GGDEF)-like protein/PAS domain S-box-containing protein